MLSLRGKEGTIRRASFLYLSLVSVWGLVWAALTSGGRLTASSHMGAEPPCSFPHFPLPLLAWNLSLQLQLSVLFFNLFPVLSLFFKPFASLSIWKVSGMKESRTWRKTLWVLHFPHFQIKKDAHVKINWNILIDGFGNIDKDKGWLSILLLDYSKRYFKMLSGGL